MTFSRSYNSPDHTGVTRGIAATGGRAGRSVSMRGAATRPAGPQGAMADVAELVNPTITRGGRRTDKPVELYPTWSRRGERGVIQQGYALTVNTFAGLGWEQRAWLDVGGQMGLSQASLLAHYDDVALPFKTDNTDLDYGGLNPHFTGEVISTVFQGRAVWAVQHGTAIYAETSPSDPTPVRILSAYVSDSTNRVLSLGVMIINGSQCLMVGTNGTASYAFGSIDPAAVLASTTTPLFATGGAIQVPLPKQPILTRVGADFYLFSSDWSTTPPTISDDARTNTIRSTFGRIRALAAVAQEPPKIWMLEGGGKITTCSVYGTQYSEFTRLSMTSVHQIEFVGRTLVARDQERIMIYDGDEYDTGIFEDAAPVSGYFYLVTAMCVVDDQVFAEVNLVPNDLQTITSGSDFGNLPSTKRALWRLDLKRQHPRWSQVSEWGEWNAHNIAPQGGSFRSASGYYGHLTSGLVYGPSTRRIHSIPSLAQNPTYRKFEPPAGQNYYSLRGRYTLASAGGSPLDLTAPPFVRTPGLVFPPPLTYLPKILDGIETGARDTAGTGGTWYYKWGEHGHLDDTNVLRADFAQGLIHADRRHPFPGNQAGALFPQLEAGIARGATTTATPSIAPVTYHFHVDLDDAPIGAPAAWLGRDRSEG